MTFAAARSSRASPSQCSRDASDACAPARVEVVDTTAAGDAFAGALAAALDRGATLPDALADGAAAGSHACTRAGAQASLASREHWLGLARELRAAAKVTAR